MIYFLVEKIICLAPFGFVQLAPWRPDTMDAGYPVIRWHQVANRAGNRYILIFFIYRAKGCNKKFFSGPGVSSWPLKKTFFEALKKMPTKMWPIRSKEGGGKSHFFADSLNCLSNWDAPKKIKFKVLLWLHALHRFVSGWELNQNTLNRNPSKSLLEIPVILLQTADYGYVPNERMEKVFMSTALDTFDAKQEGYPGGIHPRSALHSYSVVWSLYLIDTHVWNRKFDLFKAFRCIDITILSKKYIVIKTSFPLTRSQHNLSYNHT